MKKRTKNNLKSIFRKTIFRRLAELYRHQGLKEGDVFLISYQNSGSTWLRNLIYEVITGKESWKRGSKKEFAFLGNHNKLKPLVNENRFIKSHSPYRKEYEGKKVIYIVRDPRDIVVSKYHKAVKENWKVKSKNDFLDKFVKGRVMSEGLWSEHVKSWLEAKKQDKVDLHLVKYENLKKNTEKEFKEIIEFLGLKREKKQIKKAIEDNKIEKTKKVNPNARKGKAGDWKEELNEEQARKIENKFKEIMKVLNYIQVKKK